MGQGCSWTARSIANSPQAAACSITRLPALVSRWCRESGMLQANSSRSVPIHPAAMTSAALLLMCIHAFAMSLNPPLTRKLIHPLDHSSVCPAIHPSFHPSIRLSVHSFIPSLHVSLPQRLGTCGPDVFPIQGPAVAISSPAVMSVDHSPVLPHHPLACLPGGQSFIPFPVITLQSGVWSQTGLSQL